MRMRKKPNLIPRMEKCSHVLIKEPETLKGKWLSEIPGYDSLYLELGCGKGKFTVETAKDMPNILFAAVERVPDAMVIGMERVTAAEITNVRFMDRDASGLRDMFEKGEVDRIYINFCDPWPTKKRAKRRLTSDGFLSIYKSILKCGGEIHFKTDNVPLFDYSLERFEANGFEFSEVTRDLHSGGKCGVMTDYEEKFHEQGIHICKCVAKKKES